MITCANAKALNGETHSLGDRDGLDAVAGMVRCGRGKRMVRCGGGKRMVRCDGGKGMVRCGGGKGMVSCGSDSIKNVKAKIQDKPRRAFRRINSG